VAFGGPSLVEPFRDCLDSEFGDVGRVLAHGGEVDEGQLGQAAVVVADDGYVAGHVDASAQEGAEHAVGAAVVAGDDGGREGGAGQHVPGGLGPGFLGVVAGKDVDIPGQSVPAHGVTVAASALGGAGHGAAVHVRDGLVPEPGQMVDS